MKAFTTILLLLFSGDILAADDALTSRLEAFRVTLDDAGKEQLIAIQEIAPGETIEYHLIYENRSEGPLSGLIVSIPVPRFTQYQADSADATVTFQLQASIDNGTSYEAVPVMRRTEDGALAAVPADNYSNLRWMSSSAIEPGTSRTYSYRVVVQQ